MHGLSATQGEDVMALMHVYPPDMRKKSQPAWVTTYVKGSALWRALGFTSERAFQRARQTNQISLRLYPIPGQSRGVRARVDELTNYLISHSKSTKGD